MCVVGYFFSIVVIFVGFGLLVVGLGMFVWVCLRKVVVVGMVKNGKLFIVVCYF